MRTVPEWFGRNDDAMPPTAVKLRIVARQGGRCALSGAELRPGHIDFDHRIPLWQGGQNCESNLQAVTREAHRDKSAGDQRSKAKADRIRAKHLGLWPKGKPIRSRGFEKRPAPASDPRT